MTRYAYVLQPYYDEFTVSKQKISGFFSLQQSGKANGVALWSAAYKSIVMTIVALNLDCQYAACLWASREATSGCPGICCSVCAGAYSILNMWDKHTPYQPRMQCCLLVAVIIYLEPHHKHYILHKGNNKSVRFYLNCLFVQISPLTLGCMDD